MTTDSRRAIGLWLLICCALIFAMVVLGGVTRLTRSGLSIVEWNPVQGAIPPLHEADWQELFAKYRATPEFQKVNTYMDLEGFKGIFWLEYFHRLLGRLIGLVFLLPFLYFLVRRRIDASLKPKLWALFGLGAAQGLMGWLMVASGLVDEPRVSPYRLTAHLMLAVVIYGYMLWTALSVLDPRPAAHTTPGRRLGLRLTAVILLMMASGAFVAGTRAGFVFNTFPLMYGKLLPDGLWTLTPWWTNLFENLATVQFDHRLLAWVLLVLVPLFWWRVRGLAADSWTRRTADALLLAFLGQFALGVATLLSVVRTPLAASHQAGALVVLSLVLVLSYRLGRR